MIANAATARRLRAGDRCPWWMRALQRATAAPLARGSERLVGLMARRQRPGSPLLGPQPPTDDGPDNLLDSGPLRR